MSQTLYRKYRPQSWADIAGQNHVKVTLAFEVETGKLAHAYLFSGPRGVGKTTIARILAKALNCLDRRGGEPCGKCESCEAVNENKTLDVIEIDAASHRGIDAVRENIIENARFSPSRLKYKIFIIDEVHMLTAEAFNALLKTLEEPPAQTVFVLATTELHKVPPTIISRCQRFDFRKIPFADLVERLHGICEREGVKVDKRALEEIARNSDGCLRDAEGLLGKVLSLGDGKRVSYDEALVVLPRSSTALVSAFTEALLRRDGRAALSVIDDSAEEGIDADQFTGDVIELLRRILLAKVTGDVSAVVIDMDEEQKRQLEGWRELREVGDLVKLLELFIEKRRDVKLCQPPQLPLEIAVARYCAGMTDIVEESPRPAPPTKRPVVQPAAPLATPKAPAAPVQKIEAAPEIPRAVHIEPTVPAAVRQDEVLPPAAAAPPTTVGCVCGFDLDAVRAKWGDFLRLVGEENHSLTFLLGVAEPVEIAGGVVKVGFNYVFHRDKFNSAKNRQAAEKAMSALLAEPVRMEGLVLERKVEMVNNDPAPAAAAAAPATPVDSLAAAFGGRVME
ncbi:MAG: DNA polymerase III subunit gamma/tau [Patescibacteria group bacterium]|jgi:DNA polymerase-3 subunit gamma/tau